MSTRSMERTRSDLEAGRGGVALIMVLIVLSILSMIGAPFVISMALQDRASLNFFAAVAARQGAESARNHAIAHLQRTAYGVEYESESAELEGERPAVVTDARPSAFSGSLRASSAPKRRGGGMIVRRDLGERPEERREDGRRGGASTLGGIAGGARDASGLGRGIPEALSSSRRGPSQREFDTPDEIDVPPLDRVTLPAAW